MTTASESIRQRLAQMRKQECVLRYENTVICIVHRRGHFLILGKFGRELGIRTVNFLSPYRLRQMMDWFAKGSIVPYAAVGVRFAAEVQAKLLPSAQDYLPWLESGRMRIVTGSTSDTLQSVAYDPDRREASIQKIASMLAEGAAGPFLAFDA